MRAPRRCWHRRGLRQRRCAPPLFARRTCGGWEAPWGRAGSRRGGARGVAGDCSSGSCRLGLCRETSPARFHPGGVGGIRWAGRCEPRSRPAPPRLQAAVWHSAGLLVRGASVGLELRPRSAAGLPGPRVLLSQHTSGLQSPPKHSRLFFFF